MLIDRMKEHPKEFRNYDGKFSGMLELAQEVQRGATRNMSKRDAHAIMAAAEEHLFEVWLAEDVLTKMMAPKQEERVPLRNPGNALRGQMQGHVIAQSVLGGPYEQVMAMEKAKYKMEIEEQQKRDIYHAQRNTNPFKPFI